MGCHLWFVFLINSLFLSQQSPDGDYLKMKGERITHSISDSVKIIELRSHVGLTKWYGQDMTLEVCLTGLCKDIHLWVFWDCLGNYLGFDINENKPLTKAEHEPFEDTDYQKLHKVLIDNNSIFRFLSYDDLVVREDDRFMSLDGISGATNPDLNAYAVEGAI